MRYITIAAMTVLLFFATGGPSQAGDFHTGTGLVCSDCHTMHYSEGGTTPSGAGGGPAGHLLLQSNVTDLCLSCHSDPTKGPDVFNATDELPGGDFAPGGTQADANGHDPAPLFVPIGHRSISVALRDAPACQANR